MKRLFFKIIGWTRRKVWALIVAYMLGLHNFYYGDDKTPDNIVITIEHNEVQEDDAPVD